jgi:hypothetical protein
MIRAQLVSGLALAALLGAFNPAFAQSTTSAAASSNSSATTKKPLKCANAPANTLPKGCVAGVPVQGSTSADVNANILDNSAGVTTGVNVNTPRSSANPVYTPPSTGVAADTSGTTGSTSSTGSGMTGSTSTPSPTTKPHG